MNFAPYHIRRHLGFAVLLAGAIALSGCQTTTTRGSSKGTIRILQSEPLKVPDNCAAIGSYFVDFTVMSDGRTGHDEHVVDAVPDTLALPTTQIVVDRLPGREVMRQEAPCATGWSGFAKRQSR